MYYILFYQRFFKPAKIILSISIILIKNQRLYFRLLSLDSLIDL